MLEGRWRRRCGRGMWSITFSKDGHTPHQEMESNSLLLHVSWLLWLFQPKPMADITLLGRFNIKFRFCPFHQNTPARALSYHVSTLIVLRVPCCEEAQSTWSRDCIEKPWDYMKREKCLLGLQLLQFQPPLTATAWDTLSHNCPAGPFLNYWLRETMTNEEIAIVVLSH